LDGYFRHFVDDPAYDLPIRSVHFFNDHDQVVECIDRFPQSRRRYKTLRELYCEYFRANRLVCESGRCGWSSTASRTVSSRRGATIVPRWRLSNGARACLALKKCLAIRSRATLQCGA